MSLEFQITSWYAADYDQNYVVKIFGVTATGKTVSVNLLDYTPYFYVKLTGPTNQFTCMKMREFLTGKLPANSLVSAKIMKKQDFYGFHNGETFNFIRFAFKSLNAFKSAARLLQKEKHKLYESNIEPFLRLMHIQDFEPTGWVSIKEEYLETNTDIWTTTCQIDVACKWNTITGVIKNDMAPFKIASFDLECTSSHGDFPVPIKDYKKVANEIIHNLKTSYDSESLANEIIKIYMPNEPGKLSKVFTKKTPYIPYIESRIKLAIDDIMSIISGKSVSYKNGENVQNLVEKLNNMGLPELEGDKIIQIGVTVHNYGEKTCNYKCIITLGSCDPIENVDIICCENEKEMLLKFKELIVNKIDPDVITGYNILGFDFEYMHKRACELGIVKQFTHCLGRINEGTTAPYGEKTWPFVVKKLASSALGENLLKYIEMEGRVIIDLMKVVQRDHKLDSYKLDNVANHFMKMNKNDLNPNDIFRLFKGDSNDRRIIAEYCVQDCALCNQLMIKLEVLANNIGMSNVCQVPLSYIFLRGQGIKIFSLVAKQCRLDNFVIPTLNNSDNEDDSGYEGAIVLEPKTGIYIDQPISVLDYASLYPSSMISENLSHDTLVLNSRYDNIPGVEYLDISYDVFDENKQKVGTKVSRFVQTSEKGVLPRILLKLLQQRKETRKKIDYKTVKYPDGTVFTGLLSQAVPDIADIADITDITDTYNEFQKAVLDGLQLAYKITANSLYGQTGARMSSIYCKDVAASTTATGRNMILLAKKYIEENYQGSEIIYGDSVTGYTPVVIKTASGTINVERFEVIASKYGDSKWQACSGGSGSAAKEACELRGVHVWTDKGWTQVHRIIRHELAPEKNILRVLTHTGSIDVTDDHSLFTLDNVKISPRDLVPGMEILHSTIDFGGAGASAAQKLNKYEARIMGYFLTAGTCNKTFILRADKTYYELCCKVYHDLEWIMDDKYIYPISGNIQALEAKYHQLFYDTNKIVPQLIFNASKDAQEAFWDGLLDYKEGFKHLKNHQVRQGIYVLSLMLGFSSYSNETNKIKSISRVNYSGYVYDLTTENHKFQAGIGDIIASNTDSLFVKFNPRDKDGNLISGKAAIPLCREIGIKVSKEIKSIIKKPHDLEWEKLFWPFILLSKKRYIANKYEYDDNKYKQSSMGVVLKRRDNAPIVKTIYGGIIDIILNEQDIKKSLLFLNKCLLDLINGKYPLEELIITKGLKSEYKDPEKIAHKVLADRMKERDPGSAPQVNDRLPYIYIVTNDKKALQGERIEHPDYIRAHNIKPDYEFYLTNQIMKPILQVYALVLENLQGYKKGREYFKDLYGKILREKEGDEKKTRDRINDLRDEQVKKILFDPILIKLENKKRGNREISEFFNKAI
jgi:DNA polymerase elongation subunit (family B)